VILLPTQNYITTVERKYFTSQQDLTTMSDVQEFSQGDASNLRRLLGKAGPERAFDIMKESWRGRTKSIILATTSRCWISMPEAPSCGGETQIHDRIRPWSFVWRCFRHICWALLRKDPGGFYSRAFHPGANEEESWWLYITSGAFGGHAPAWYQSLFGEGLNLPEPATFQENEV